MKDQKPIMDWIDIKSALHRKGMTLTGLALQEGLHSSQCRKVKTIPDYKAQAAIAKFLNVKPEQLWPSRYPKGRSTILDTNKYPHAASPKVAHTADKRDAA